MPPDPERHRRDMRPRQAREQAQMQRQAGEQEEMQEEFREQAEMQQRQARDHAEMQDRGRAEAQAQAQRRQHGDIHYDARDPPDVRGRHDIAADVPDGGSFRRRRRPPHQEPPPPAAGIPADEFLRRFAGSRDTAAPYGSDARPDIPQEKHPFPQHHRPTAAATTAGAQQESRSAPEERHAHFREDPVTQQPAGLAHPREQEERRGEAPKGSEAGPGDA